MGLLTRAQAWLTGTAMPAAASPAGPVAYQRRADGRVTVLTGAAWVGRTAFRRDPAGERTGAAVVIGDRDYLIPVSALPRAPERGDRVTETVGGRSVTFEVRAPAGEPAWRYADPGRTLYRVHCAEVE